MFQGTVGFIYNDPLFVVRQFRFTVLPFILCLNSDDRLHIWPGLYS